MSADPTDVVPRKRQGAAPSSIRYKRSRSRSPSPSNDSHAYLHLRGLPWRINESEVREFMEREVRVDDVILVLLRDGRQSGEALVKLQKGEKVSAAMKLHLSHLGRRYVEVRESNEKEWEREQLRKAKDAQIEHLDLTEDAGLSSGGRMVDLIARNYGIILRVRGLPFRTNEQDIREFFSAVKIRKLDLEFLVIILDRLELCL